jgi:hypothetical protein
MSYFLLIDAAPIQSGTSAVIVAERGLNRVQESLLFCGIILLMSLILALITRYRFYLFGYGYVRYIRDSVFLQAYNGDIEIIDYAKGKTGRNWFRAIIGSLIILIVLACVGGYIHDVVSHEASFELVVGLVALIFGGLGGLVLVTTVRAMRQPSSTLHFEAQNQQLRVIEDDEVVDLIPFSEISHIGITRMADEESPGCGWYSIFLRISRGRAINIGRLSGYRFSAKRRIQPIVSRLSDLTDTPVDVGSR